MATAGVAPAVATARQTEGSPARGASAGTTHWADSAGTGQGAKAPPYV